MTDSEITSQSSSPKPPHLAFSVSNVKLHVPIQLSFSQPNYKKWSRLFLLLARRFNLHGYLNGSIAPISDEDDEWFQLDAILQGWILSTITDEVSDLVLSSVSTASAFWKMIHDLFHDNKHARAMQLEHQFRTTVKGSTPMAAYCQELRNIAPKEKWDDRDCKKHNLDNVAKAAIFKTLDPITFSKIKHLKTAMEIWQGLGKLCEGSEDLRKQKIENVRLLRSLPTEWYTKATAMEEGRNLENYTVQGLLDELRTYEHELKKKKEEQVTPFPTALMTTPRVPPSEGTCPRNCDTPSSSQPSSSKMENCDEEFAMMVKQFRKFKKFFKKTDSVRRPSKGKPQVSDSPPESYLCYNCRKPGHWKSACPYPKVEKYGERERNEKKKKAMVAAESDESSSSSSDEEALVCMERRAEKSNHEDRWTMSEDGNLCLMAKDDADQEVTSQTSCSSSYESIPTSENLFDQFKKMMEDFEEINLKHLSLTEENKLLSEENLKLTEGRKSQLDEITQLRTENESLSEKVKSLNKELGILKSKEAVDKLLETNNQPTIKDLGYSLEFCKDMASLKNISTNEVILTGKRIRNIYEVMWDNVKEACLISKDKDEEVNEEDRMKPTEFIPFRSLPLKTSQRNPDSDSGEPSGNFGQPSNIPDLSNGDNSGNGDPVPIHPETPTTSVLQPEAELDQPVNPNQHNLRWLRDHPPQQIIGDIQSGVRTRSAQQNLEAMLAYSSDFFTRISEKMKIVGANVHFQTLEAKCSSPAFYQSYLEMIAAQELSKFLQMEIRLKFEEVLEFYRNGEVKTAHSKKDPQRTFPVIKSTVGAKKVDLNNDYKLVLELVIACLECGSGGENRAGASATAEESSSDNVPLINLAKTAKRKHVVSPSPSVEAPQNLPLINLEEEEEVSDHGELQRKKKRKINSPSTSGNVNPDELKEKEPAEETSAQNQSPQQLEEETPQAQSLLASSQPQTDDAENKFWQLYYNWRAWKVGNSAEQLLDWDQQLKSEKIIKKCLGLPVNQGCEDILNDYWVWQRNNEDLHLEHLATTPVSDPEADDEDTAVYKPIFSKVTEDQVILTYEAQADLEATTEDFQIFPETSHASEMVLTEAVQEKAASPPSRLCISPLQKQNQKTAEEGEFQQQIQSHVLEILTTAREISNQPELDIPEKSAENPEQQEIEQMEARYNKLLEKSEEKHNTDLKEIGKSVEKTLEIISLLSKIVSNTIEIYASDSQLQFKEFNKVKEQIASVTVGLQKQMSLLQMDIRSALAVASANQVVTKDYLKVIIDNQKEAFKLFRLLGANFGNRKMEVILQQQSPSPIPQLPIAVKEGEVSYIPSHLNMTNLILEAQQRNPENSAQHLSSSSLDGTEFIGTVVDHFSNDAQSEERRENLRRIKELCGNMQGISEMLRGLPDDLQAQTSFLQFQDPLPSFLQVRSALLLLDRQGTPLGGTSSTALLAGWDARSFSGNQHGGGGSRGPPHGGSGDRAFGVNYGDGSVSLGTLPNQIIIPAGFYLEGLKLFSKGLAELLRNSNCLSHQPQPVPNVFQEGIGSNEVCKDEGWRCYHGVSSYDRCEEEQNNLENRLIVDFTMEKELESLQRHKPLAEVPLDQGSLDIFHQVIKDNINLFRKSIASKQFLDALNKGQILNYSEEVVRITREAIKSFEYIDAAKMEGARWTPDYDAETESPLIPVWVGLEGLPIHLFDSAALYSIANLIGRPLRTDSATRNLTRPSVARVCVELDLSKEIPKAIWIHLGKLSSFQPIYYEDLPAFCSGCKQLGHTNCKEGVRSSRWTRRDTSKTNLKAQVLSQPRASKPLQQDTKAEQQLTTDSKEAFSDVDMAITLDKHQATAPLMALPMDSNTPIVTPAPMDTSISPTPHVIDLRQYPFVSVDGIEQVEQSEANNITNCFDCNTTKNTKDGHSTSDPEVVSVAVDNLTKEADLEPTQEHSIEESMDGNTINLDEFPVLTRQNMEEEVHTPTVEAVVHTSTETEKDNTTGTLMAEDTTKENTTPNNSDVNPASIGPILHSFEHDGQNYEIRSYMEEGQTSNRNDENLIANEFQEVQNKKRSKLCQGPSKPEAMILISK
ncbi:unnamed protein product [Cuscuta campestris]|uniref:CCHC-type domain-containing protein n=1 Tax=Cuscuta campestris TaxID=132261 RepID=A0A484M9C9_9ASTE|nr:unnamed protein product [Cuscuta campestris]